MSEEIAGELVPVVETNELVNKFAFFDGRVTRYVIYGVAITGASLATILLIKRLTTRRSNSKSHVNCNGKTPNSKSTAKNRQDSPFHQIPSAPKAPGLNALVDDDEPPKTFLPSKTMCISCRNSRRLSWSAKSYKSKSPQELLHRGLMEMKAGIKCWQDCIDKWKAGGDHDMTKDQKLQFLIECVQKSCEELEDIKSELFEDQYEDETGLDDIDASSVVSHSSIMTSTTLYQDVEPNLHFFKLYQHSLENLEFIPVPRVNRTEQLCCETFEEFVAKVNCLRMAFVTVFEEVDTRQWFIGMGKEILEVLLKHSLRDPSECLAAYNAFLEFVEDTTNHEAIEIEIAGRKIPCLSFYDLVLDYIIMDSFDDLDDPPSAVASVANNRWLSAGFRELALQTAVSQVLRYKRTKLAVARGFFGHFYSILDHVSPILAWGFLGSDQDLKFKCSLVKESLQELIRDYFSFDRVRYTNVNDLSEDIVRVTKERFWDLNNKLSICTL